MTRRSPRCRVLLAVLLASALGPAAAGCRPAAPFTVVRLGDGPIVHAGTPGLQGELGASINGPSLIRVPSWVPDPLGRYYLYFAHHHGTFIRLAYADRLEGPWTVHPGGVLPLAATAARHHVASPDVHVDAERRRILLYFHGPASETDRARQVTFLATSPDGLHFTASPRELGPFYFRVFGHGGQRYALAKEGDRTGVLLRSADGETPFERGPEILPRMRHAAVLVRGDVAWIVFSRLGDAPESLLFAPLRLTGDWRGWRPDEPVEVLRPERSWEGAGEPVAASRSGRAWTPKQELRDPAFFVEDGRIYLLYAVAGEHGIALAEVRER
ncbi:MAG TPA: hypothetical protein VEL74_23120 [Thermoanaerobaculia bacterium]|nr:hypothetical protein [Thermoanaerobaculia bacterium]